MLYRDIIGIERQLNIGDSPVLFQQCIAWTAGHETALFEVDTEIHPATVAVWFFPMYFNAETWKYDVYTHKYQFLNNEWVCVNGVKIDKGEGMPALTDAWNFNPFCPYDKTYTGGHFACCQFPQNASKHPGGICKNTAIVERRRLVLGSQV